MPSNVARWRSGLRVPPRPGPDKATWQTDRSDGLLKRLFMHFTHAQDMNALVRRARSAGIATALLSNSWGNTYPEHLFDGMFDVVVISGEVGMRKPEERIFRYTLDKLGLAAEQCAFVDDLRHNVDAAISLGLVGIHHVSYDQTAMELEALFEADLSDLDPISPGV